MANVKDSIGPTAIEYAAANITTLRLGRNMQRIVLLGGLPLQFLGLRTSPSACRQTSAAIVYYSILYYTLGYYSVLKYIEAYYNPCHQQERQKGRSTCARPTVQKHAVATPMQASERSRPSPPRIQ